ncbi:MAG TPA: hypothetical protein VLD55_04350 [Candidatus Sulfobium mesophilum]|nr:hypothetical protein [Candidatus Sulfobium mesophilum]
MDANYQWTLFLDQDSVSADDMVADTLRSYGQLANEAGESVGMLVSVVFDINFGKIVPSVITTSFLNKKVRNPSADCYGYADQELFILPGNTVPGEIPDPFSSIAPHFFNRSMYSEALHAYSQRSRVA